MYVHINIVTIFVCLFVGGSKQIFGRIIKKKIFYNFVFGKEAFRNILKGKIIHVIKVYDLINSSASLLFI